MSDIPTRASAVVIGAGIVGNSLVHHLALLGWKTLNPRPMAFAEGATVALSDYHGADPSGDKRLH